MTARSGAHLVTGAICNFSLTPASPACSWQGAPAPRRTQESVDSHDTLDRARAGGPPPRTAGPRASGRPAGQGALALKRYLLLERLGAGGFGVV